MGVEVIRVLAYAVLSRAMLVAFSLIAAWLLDSENFGVFSYVVLTTSSVATLSAVGVNVTCNTTAARHHADNPELVVATVSSTLTLSWVLAVVASAFWVAVTPTAVSAVLGIETTGAVIFALALIMASTTAFEGTSYGLRALPGMLVAAALSFVFAVGGAAIGAGTLGLMGVLGALLASRLLFLVLMAGGALRILGARPSFAVIWRYRVVVTQIFRKVGLPIALAAVLSAPVVAGAVNVMTRTGGLRDVGEFNIIYQVFLICTFPASSISHYLLSRFSGNAEDLGDTVCLKSFAIGFALLLGGIALVVLWLAPGAMELAAFAVQPAPALGIWFGISAALYIVHLMFISYWSSIDRGLFVLIAQLMWAAPMLAAMIIGGGAVFFAQAFAVGCVLQIGFHWLAYWRTATRIAAERR
ncbi:hypothetical protein C0V72_14280 [Porphyrobacter sp. TH134]|uniref:hypothetical protein n=1 Tax=Porphyrobacter sp. TH134 TaxID=2067450 RepID=UPI000C7CC61C|nr:hypothetical protein [Porphyrobacter sp. TH134]PLK22552.1 hypothetical protein C0V72_14280 [Porphyrobacter sp. TH134]